MKIYIYSIMVVLSLGFYSCSDDEEVVGNPIIDVETSITSAMFGDSLEFTVNVSDEEVPLSTLKAFVYFSDELVSETVIRTKTNGDYTGKVYIPFYANIPNGTATLRFALQNINLTITEQDFDLPLTRPDYPYLTLVTEDEEIQMDRTSLYEYEVTQTFPADVPAYIKAPAMGEQGNEITFGWQDNSVVEGSTADIPYSNFPGEYTIAFNTLTYATAPFMVYTINDEELVGVDANSYKTEQNFVQGEEIVVDGIIDFDSWWIDPDFFDVNGEKITFKPIDGKYRITANFELKYLMVEAMNGSDLATLQADGSGAIWIIGQNVGKPSLGNETGWNTNKGLCLAPIGDGKYQISLEGGKNLSLDEINFKFFHQKDWGVEYSNETLTTTSDLVFVGDGENGRDPGNLGLAEGVELEAGRSYVFTVDVSAGIDNAVLTVE